MGAVAWVGGAGGCWVEFCGAGGERQRLLLGACATLAFEDVPPVRGFPNFKGQKNFPGLWWSATSGSHVGYESWLERDWLMAFDSSPKVAGVSSQPFRLSWPVAGKTVRHTPDYFLRLHDGGAMVVDVRADDRIDPEDAAVFDATAVLCGSVGWRYRRVGQMPVVRAANLRWLSGYRHRRCYRSDFVAALGNSFSRPRRLAEGALEVGDPVAVMPVLFHLLWRREIVADIESALLGPDMVIGGERR